MVYAVNSFDTPTTAHAGSSIMEDGTDYTLRLHHLRLFLTKTNTTA
ncbi:MAG: hypothetical protein SOT07_04895 [Paludibacteraceae bacterium]|nr:hypothetical protein [Paludibacteraceae bacterium]